MIDYIADIFKADPQGYIRSFVDEGTELADLLAQYLRHRQHSFIRKSLNVVLLYVKKLLQLMNVQSDGALAFSSLLTEQETKILRMVQQGLMNRQIAEKLNVTGSSFDKRKCGKAEEYASEIIVMYHIIEIISL